MPKRLALTEGEKRFAAGILEGKSHTRAAMDAGFSPHNRGSAAVRATRMLKRANVREYIDSLSMEAVRGILGIARDKKVSAKTRLSAYQDIADRSLGKATQGVDLTTGGKPLIKLD